MEKEDRYPSIEIEKKIDNIKVMEAVRKEGDRQDKFNQSSDRPIPCFGFDMHRIESYWEKLSDYESKKEYIEKILSQWSFVRQKYAIHFHGITQTAYYTTTWKDPIPLPQDDELLDKILYRLQGGLINFFRIIISDREFNPLRYRAFYESITYTDEDTDLKYFSYTVTANFIQGYLQKQSDKIDYLLSCGEILRREKTVNESDTPKNTGRKGGKKTWYLDKFICPENRIKSIDIAFQRLSHKATLKLPENYNIANYLSTKPEKKDKKKLREQIIDWSIPDDLAGFVAFIEILEEDYGTKKIMPSMARATFTREGDDIGGFETYKSSREAANSFEKRKKIEERKSQLRKIIEIN